MSPQKTGTAKTNEFSCFRLSGGPYRKTFCIVKKYMLAQWDQCKNNFFIAILQFASTTQNFWFPAEEWLN